MPSKLKKWVLAAAAVLFVSIFLSAQKSQLEGAWKGIITQEMPDGPTSEYDILIRIVQDGKKLKGQTTVTWGEKSAKMSFSGRVERKVVIELTEKDFVEKSELEDSWDWCLKNMKLVLKEKDGYYFLEGYWVGKSKFGVCKPGKLLVKKQAPRV